MSRRTVPEPLYVILAFALLAALLCAAVSNGWADPAIASVRLR